MFFFFFLFFLPAMLSLRDLHTFLSLSLFLFFSFTWEDMKSGLVFYWSKLCRSHWCLFLSPPCFLYLLIYDSPLKGAWKIQFLKDPLPTGWSVWHSVSTRGVALAFCLLMNFKAQNIWTCYYPKGCSRSIPAHCFTNTKAVMSFREQGLHTQKST